MKVVSLFSGAGGFDLGFIQAGHKVIWANDNWQEATETYALNLGDHIICNDIREISSDDIPDSDVVIGGFPCQGFSHANTGRHEKDERNFRDPRREVGPAIRAELAGHRLRNIAPREALRRALRVLETRERHRHQQDRRQEPLVSPVEFFGEHDARVLQFSQGQT